MTTMPRDGITMSAKFGGRCQACTEEFPAGEQIQFYGNKEVYHFDCRPMGSKLTSEPEPKQSGYIFCDLETGGLDENKCAIVQIAGIACSNNFVYQSTFQSLIYPPEDLLIEEKSTEVHGHTRLSLSSERIESIVIDDFVDWCRKFPDYRFAGYNCLFDLKFLAKAYKRNGVDGRVYLLPPYDPLPIAKEKLGRKTKNHKLTTVAEHYGFKTNGAHDALVDLFLTIQVARELRKIG